MGSSRIARLCRAASACALAVALLCTPCALADPAPWVASIPNALSVSGMSGNAFYADDGVEVSGAIERDAYAAGSLVTVSNAKVGSDVLAAGKDVRVRSSIVSGSVRLAGQSIVLADTAVGSNVNAACQSYAQGPEVVVNGCVMVACGDADIEGSSTGLIAYAHDVYVNGTVDGDVDITASSVSFGPNAKVTGLISVTASEEPLVDPLAQIGVMEFTLEETDDFDATLFAGGLAALVGGLSMLFLVLGLLGTIACALLVEVFFRKATAGAARMIKQRTAPFIVSGVIAAIVAPFAFAISVGLLVTLPLAGALLFVMLAITVIAGAFAGASLAKLVFPKMNRFLSALIGGLVLGILCNFPFIGWLVNVCAIMYLLGYVVQLVYIGMKADPSRSERARVEDPSTPTPPVIEETVEVVGEGD